MYLLIIVAARYSSGVTYWNSFASIHNVISAVIMPFFIASCSLVWIAKKQGIWPDLWRAKRKGEAKHYGVLTVFVVLGSLLNIYSVDTKALNWPFVLTVVVAAAMVGFAQELLCRGIVRHWAQKKYTSELKVMLITSIVFGLIHFINALAGQSLGATFWQMLYTAVFGGPLFYLLYKRYVSLVAPIFFHSLWNVGLFLQNSSTRPLQEDLQTLVIVAHMIVLIAIILVVRRDLFGSKHA